MYEIMNYLAASYEVSKESNPLRTNEASFGEFNPERLKKCLFKKYICHKGKISG
jgi:hypothetical protein